MSWDIVLFKSRQKIEKLEELDETYLEPTDFCSVLEKHFDNIVIDNNHREIKGRDYAIDYFMDEEPVSNKVVSLYGGEKGIYEMCLLAKKYGWQIYDTGIEQMIDIDDPAKNGYLNFQKYLKQILDEE